MRVFAIFLLALALSGAPFGMGRMMDTAHAGHATHISQHVSGHHSDDVPVHKAGVPHFMACAACAAAMVDASPDGQLMVLQGVLEAEETTPLTGVHALPLTPPPRA